MQIGLYLYQHRVLNVWRVVSEDSDHFSTRLAVIHCLGERSNLDQPTYSEMQVPLHQLDALYELLEIRLFRSSKFVSLEEWDDRFDQIISSSDAESIQVLFVVVVSLVEINIPNTKKSLKHVKTLDASRTLCHRKLMRHLISSFITPTTKSMRLSNEMDRKASFSVNKTGNPTNRDQPFLLIFRS
jgi:hypothetical protein